MILIDTSVWIDHFRHSEPTLLRLFHEGRILSHPWMIGELAMGHLGSARQRGEILQQLATLPQAIVCESDELLAFIERHRLFGLGIGYVDAQLLAATRLTAGARLWTRDKRLRAAAERLDVCSALDSPQ